MNKKENQKADWFNFYLDRVDSAGYEDYFRKKYALLIDIMESFLTVGLIKEEGVGIGSLTKALGGRGIYGSDICDNMLHLCKLNNPNMRVWKEDILSPNKEYIDNTFAVVTHGVLEHFSDENIFKILNTYVTKVKFSIHYVPTNMYDTPSFGDERLLPVSYWLDNFRPFHHVTDNRDRDLYLIFKH